MSVATKTHYDATSRTFAFERVQDVEPILDRNKALATERQDADAFHHIGDIPNVILERWLNEEYARGNVGLTLGSQEFLRLCVSKLRSSEWQWLRATDRKF